MKKIFIVVTFCLLYAFISYSVTMSNLHIETDGDGDSAFGQSILYGVNEDIVSNNNNIYTVNGDVASISDTEIYITTNDRCGCVIDFSNDFTINQKVEVIFDGRGTESIYDDDIVSVTGF